MEYDQDSIEARKATPNRARVWTAEEIARLIKVWSKHEVLYNTRHPDYYKREKRSVAMTDIQENLGGINVVDIIRKMENLRSYFGREIKRLSDSGIPVGETEGQSRWAYFDSLLFLEEHMNQKKATPRSDGYDSTTRSDDTITSYEHHGGELEDCAVECLEDIHKVYQAELTEGALRQIKRPRLNDRSKQDVTITRVQVPKSAAANHQTMANDSAAMSFSVKAQKDGIDTYTYPRESTRSLQADRMFGEIHEDMIFAEHVGRTIMTITDELLKEDLKLQIQQCLCATKRKQIAFQQQQQLVQHKRVSSQNSMQHWQSSDKSDAQPPTFVSFGSMESPESPIHPVPSQIDREEQHQSSKNL